MDDKLRSMEENSFSILFIDDVQEPDSQAPHTPGTPQNEVGMLDKGTNIIPTHSNIPNEALQNTIKDYVDRREKEFNGSSSYASLYIRMVSRYPKDALLRIMER